MNDLQTIKAVSCCCDDRDKGLLDTGSDKSTVFTNRISLRIFRIVSIYNTQGTLASHKVISDLEADDPEHYEGRQEGIQHNKVQCIA